MKTFNTFAELEKALIAFNFNSLTFYKGLNPVFWDSNKESFATWHPDTDIEKAEQQNSVIFVGYLSEKQAYNGQFPDIKEEMERIKYHFTKELI